MKVIIEILAGWVVIFTAVFAALALFTLGFIQAANAKEYIFQPDDVFIGVYAKSKHADDGYNESHEWKSLRLSYNLNDKTKAGVGVTSFVNSLGKDTTTIGAFIERGLMRDVLIFDDIGAGASANFQIQKGYDLPVLPIAYLYAQGKNIDELGLVGDVLERTRANVTGSPEIKGKTPAMGAVLVEFSVWKRDVK